MSGLLHQVYVPSKSLIWLTRNGTLLLRPVRTARSPKECAVCVLPHTNAAIYRDKISLKSDVYLGNVGCYVEPSNCNPC